VTAPRSVDPRSVHQQRSTSRPGLVLALLATAVASGAVAGAIAGAFIWLVDEGTHLFWSVLPSHAGADPFGAAWMYGTVVVGGVLVGLGQMLLGNYPKPLEHVIALWRSGGHVPPRTAPAIVVNSLVALVLGGPVGFEAALTGLIGATATLVGERIHAVGALVRQAWGAERVEGLSKGARQLPYWLAALAGLITYRHLPFGQIDLGFRFAPDGQWISGRDGLVAFVFAALVTVPIAWAVHTVRRAEAATLFRRSPIVVAVAGGVVFATLALGNPFVLFSGQQGIQHLVGLGTGTLLYLTIAKWVALVVALLAGWRGGPIFPSFFAVAALAAALGGPLGTAPDIAMVAGITAVSVVFLDGKIVLAFVLTLYAVPLAFTGVMLVGALGAAVALAVAGALGALPGGASDESDADADGAGASDAVGDGAVPGSPGPMR
jgi:H+/Cl- antiporter ClcA